MVGLGEEMDEVKQLLTDLRAHDVEIVTIGQYLRPSLKHHPLVRFWTPDEFAELKEFGLVAGVQPCGERPAGAQLRTTPTNRRWRRARL